MLIVRLQLDLMKVVPLSYSMYHSEAGKWLCKGGVWQALVLMVYNIGHNMKSVIITALVMVFLFAMAIGTFNVALITHHKTFSIVSLPTYTYNLQSSEIQQLVNKERIDLGLTPLASNEALCKVAAIRLSEVQTDWSQQQFVPTARPALKNQYIGENLSRGNMKNQDAVNAWILSPEHLVNIINPHYTKTCVLIKNEYIVQLFASQ